MPLCPKRDLRNVYYGTLGPQGAAVSYADPSTGRTRTTLASGPDGIYLVVVRPSRKHPARGGWFTLQSPGSGLTAVHYRDGTTCTITPANGPGGARPCEPKGYVAPAPTRASTARQVRAPVVVTIARRTTVVKGRKIGDTTVPGSTVRAAAVTFRAHVATPDARSYYTVMIESDDRGAAAHCGFGAMVGPIARTVRAGESVHFDFSLKTTCHARMTATVRLHRVGRTPDVAPYGGGRNLKDGTFVGRATFTP
jgi:hypothetical protein